MSVQKGKDKKTAKRQLFLDAAAKIFSRKGFQATNVTDIVADVESGQGTFYYHFKDKQSIFDELMIGFIEKLTSALAGNETRADGKLALASRELSIENARIIASTFLENMDIAQLFFRESKYIGGEGMKRVDVFYSLLYSQIENGLESGISDGLMREDIDLRSTAHCFVGAVERAIFETLRSGRTEDIDSLVEQIVDFQMYGIMKRD